MVFRKDVVFIIAILVYTVAKMFKVTSNFGGPNLRHLKEAWFAEGGCLVISENQLSVRCLQWVAPNHGSLWKMLANVRHLQALHILNRNYFLHCSHL